MEDVIEKYRIMFGDDFNLYQARILDTLELILAQKTTLERMQYLDTLVKEDRDLGFLALGLMLCMFWANTEKAPLFFLDESSKYLCTLKHSKITPKN